MAQDLNNPPPPPEQTPEQKAYLRNRTSDPGNPLGGISEWLGGAWNTFSGKNNYRAPENVFNPMAGYQPGASQQARQAAARSYNILMGEHGPSAYYMGLMNGTKPSLAALQTRQNIADAQRRGFQLASSARGMDRAAAFRQAQNNAANLTGQAAIAGGQQRLQEQQLGAQGLSQGLQAGSNMANVQRQQDIAEQQGLFGLQNQAQSNLNQQYQINAGVTGQNAANQQKAAGGLVQMGGALLAGLSDIRAKEDIKPASGSAQGSYTPYAGPDPNAMARSMAPGVTAQAPAAASPFASALMSYGQAQNQQANGGGMFNSGDSANFSQIGQNISGKDSGGGSSIPIIGDMLSDEDSKEALKGIHPYQFRYKDEAADMMGREAANNAYQQAFADAKTPRMGIMAQDMAANPETRDAVIPTPAGLAIDQKRATALMLATQADLNDRLARLERRKGK